MFRRLLEERFQLKAHRERRQSTVYEMTVDRGGLKMSPSPADQPRITLGFGGSATWIELDDEVRILRGKGTSLDELAVVIGRKLGSPVRNQTGISETFNYEARFSDGMDDSNAPSLVAALGDLGLRLQKSTGFIDVLRVEHVERPSQN